MSEYLDLLNLAIVIAIVFNIAAFIQCICKSDWSNLDTIVLLNVLIVFIGLGLFRASQDSGLQVDNNNKIQQVIMENQDKVMLI